MNKKHIYVYIFGLILLILLGALIYVGISSKKEETIVQEKTPSSFLSIDKKIIYIEIADTVEEQGQGLSGRDPLPKDRALLFIFEKSDKWGFWMKDMKFPIDMIWLDKNFNVVFIKKNADPKMYPEVYINQTPALYVLEIYSGFVADHSINIGDHLDFTLKN